LPRELAEWIEHARPNGPLEKNRSQLQALQIFMKELQDRLNADVQTLKSLAGQGDQERLLKQVELVDSRVAKSHFVWGFFRSKLGQRFVPHFTRSLLATDLIAYDCYRTVMDNAESIGVEQKLTIRDYPLTFFQEEYSSPVTWPRASMLSGLDYRTLPVPIVGIPWGHQRNAWDFLSLHHEVAHALDTDLGDLSAEIAEAVAQRLKHQKVANERINVWKKWIPEIFADFLGILLGGPAFVGFLSHFLTFSEDYVCEFDVNNEHPTPFLRILLNVQFVKTLAIRAEDYVDGLSAQWTSLYYDPADKQMRRYCSDFDEVIRAFTDSPLELLKDKVGSKHRFSDLAMFTAQDWSQQLQLSGLLSGGVDATLTLPLRHVTGATHVAIESVDESDPEAVDSISEASLQRIFALAPAGQLAIRSKRSKERIQFLAGAYYDT
jgi:hypothetical protein